MVLCSFINSFIIITYIRHLRIYGRKNKYRPSQAGTILEQRFVPQINHNVVMGIKGFVYYINSIMAIISPSLIRIIRFYKRKKGVDYNLLQLY